VEQAAHAAEVESVVGIRPSAAGHPGALEIAKTLHVLEELPELGILASSTADARHGGQAAAAAAAHPQ
jgi:hypothetical protein